MNFFPGHLQEARHRVLHRRGADGVRPHGQNVGVRALRAGRAARHPHLQQEDADRGVLLQERPQGEAGVQDLQHLGWGTE